MLAISRRPGQAIYIFPSEDIDPELTVAELFQGGAIKLMMDIKNGQIKVGIAAPKELTVLREELVAEGRVPRFSLPSTQRTAKNAASKAVDLPIDPRPGNVKQG